MPLHIIIQTERRTQPERMATPITTEVEQLHSLSYAGLPEDISDPQFVAVFEWDGAAPFVTVHKGDYAARNMGFLGWPDLTKEQYDALAVAADPA
jgi:hypothetical protein